MFAIDRVAGLEKANGRIRDRAKLLLEKSDADDRLVDALRNEIQASTEHRFRLTYVYQTNLNWGPHRLYMPSVGGARKTCSRAR